MANMFNTLALAESSTITIIEPTLAPKPTLAPEPTTVDAVSTEAAEAPVTPVQDEAPVTEAPVPPVQDAAPVAEAPKATATATVTVAPFPTSAPVPQPKGLSPLLIGGIILVVAAAAVLAALLLKKGRNGKGRSAEPRTVSIGLEENNTQPTPPLVYDGPRISVGMAQTQGARQNQQDSLYCSEWQNSEALASRGMLAAVADGIGGLSDGNLASMAAVKGMRARFLSGMSMGSMSDRLLDLACTAQREVLGVNAQHAERSGSTLVTVLISGWDLVFLSIGDSRICLYRSGGLLQLNREHVLGRVNQERQAFGMSVDPTKKAGALTAYLGQEGLQLIDRSLNPFKLLPGDRIVLMSDGVFGTLSDAELITHLRNGDPDTAAKSIIDAVDKRAKPRQDNATVLVIGIG